MKIRQIKPRSLHSPKSAKQQAAEVPREAPKSKDSVDLTGVAISVGGVAGATMGVFAGLKTGLLAGIAGAVAAPIGAACTLAIAGKLLIGADNSMESHGGAVGGGVLGAAVGVVGGGILAATTAGVGLAATMAVLGGATGAIGLGALYVTARNAMKKKSPYVDGT